MRKQFSLGWRYPGCCCCRCCKEELLLRTAATQTYRICLPSISLDGAEPGHRVTLVCAPRTPGVRAKESVASAAVRHINPRRGQYQSSSTHIDQEELNTRLPLLARHRPAADRLSLGPDCLGLWCEKKRELKKFREEPFLATRRRRQDFGRHLLVILWSPPSLGYDACGTRSRCNGPPSRPGDALTRGRHLRDMLVFPIELPRLWQTPIEPTGTHADLKSKRENGGPLG